MSIRNTLSPFGEGLENHFLISKRLRWGWFKTQAGVGGGRREFLYEEMKWKEGGLHTHTGSIARQREGVLETDDEYRKKPITKMQSLVFLQALCLTRNFFWDINVLYGLPVHPIVVVRIRSLLERFTNGDIEYQENFPFFCVFAPDFARWKGDLIQKKSSSTREISLKHLHSKLCWPFCFRFRAARLWPFMCSRRAGQASLGFPLAVCETFELVRTFIFLRLAW